jgi:four helix bundle protein
MRDFKRIKAWQRAHALSIAINKLTRSFTRRGHGQLRTQLNRAAGSIAANIVEGCGASSNKEFARYLEISISSANEAEYHLLAARDFALVSEDEWEKYSSETIEVRKMVFGYRKKVLGDSGDEEGTSKPDLAAEDSKAG